MFALERVGVDAHEGLEVEAAQLAPLLEIERGVGAGLVDLAIGEEPHAHLDAGRTGEVHPADGVAPLEHPAKVELRCRAHCSITGLHAMVTGISPSPTSSRLVTLALPPV